MSALSDIRSRLGRKEGVQGDIDLRRELVALHEKLNEMSAVLDRLVWQGKQDAKWKAIFRKQLAAVIRAQYLDSDLPAPHALEARRFRLRSQNEEDGIVLALLKATGIRDRRFVEIGSGGTGGNSSVLAYELAWTGLMIDASGSAVRAARTMYAARPNVTIERQFVTSDNIDELVTKYGFAGEVDLLSIDVDSIDYWLLDALTVTRPRVLVVEYNALFGPDRAVTLPNVPKPKGVPKGYFGASLSALDRCAQRKGYRLVLCEDAGINAFFVRMDLAPDVPTLTPAQAWRPKSDRYDVTGEVPALDVDIYKMIAEHGLPLVDL